MRHPRKFWVKTSFPDFTLSDHLVYLTYPLNEPIKNPRLSWMGGTLTDLSKWWWISRVAGTTLTPWVLPEPPCRAMTVAAAASHAAAGAGRPGASCRRAS